MPEYLYAQLDDLVEPIRAYLLLIIIAVVHENGTHRRSFEWVLPAFRWSEPVVELAPPPHHVANSRGSGV